MTHSEDYSQNSATPLDVGQRKLATIMFSDICNYTGMMAKDEARTLQLVKKNQGLHQKLINKYHGSLIKEMGDGLLISFNSPSDAVNCATEILLVVKNIEGLKLHIGIHQGEVNFTNSDIYGEGVNITARIDSEAWPGEILVSDDVWRNIRNKGEFNAKSIGNRNLKNVPEPMELFRIIVDEDNNDKLRQFLRRRKDDIINFGTVLIALILIVAIGYWGYQEYYVSKDEFKTIAILPFKNETNNQEFDYLSEGLADDVIKQFSHLSYLSVISSRSSFRFKETNKTIRQLSRALKADLIMDGSYIFENDKLLVKMELIIGNTNEIICYASPVASLDEIKSIAAEIETEVFKALNITLEGKYYLSLDNQKNINAEAYKYYVLGQNAMRDNTVQDRNDIIAYFNAAIQLDSTYADPYIGLAEAYCFDLNRGYVSIDEVSSLIRENVLMVEYLRPGSGEVQGLLGALYLWELKYKDAIPFFEKSIKINPNNDFVYSNYAYTLASLGQFDEAIIMIDRATILDPLNNFYRVFKPIYLTFLKRYDEAQELLKAELKLNAENAHLLWTLAVLHIEKKDYDSAYEVLIRRGIGLETNFIAGYTYAMLGLDEKAELVLNNLLGKSRKGFVPPSQLAILYVGLGRYEEAIEQIEQAYLTKDSWLFWVKYSSMMDPIRNYPRFIEVMEMINN